MSTENFAVTRGGTLKAYTGAGGAVIIPEGVKKIGERAFYRQTAITSVTIPAGVEEIGRSAFGHCKALEGVRFPEGLSKIGEAAFYACAALTRIELPDGLKAIGENAFARCEGVREAVLPGSLRRVSGQAFWGCTGLEAVRFSEGVESIGVGAFESCAALEEIDLPESLKSLDNSAFMRCASLRRVGVWGTLLRKIQIYAAPVIFAPQTPITAFSNWNKPGAAAGFAVLISQGVSLEEDIRAGYLKYIKANKTDLFPQALEHVELLRVLLAERLLSREEIQTFQKEADRRELPAIRGIISEYSD